MSIGQIASYNPSPESEADELVRLNHLSGSYSTPIQTARSFHDLDIGENFGLDIDGWACFQKNGENTYICPRMSFGSQLMRDDTNVYVVDKPLRVYQFSIAFYKTVAKRCPFKDLPIGKQFAFTPNKIFSQMKCDKDEISWYEHPKGSTVADSQRGSIVVKRKVTPEEMEAETIYVELNSIYEPKNQNF